MTYDEIVVDPKIPSQEKKDLLEGWIKKRINQERERLESMFNSYVATRPLQARGFIRNTYVIIKNKEGADVFDVAATRMGYKSADDMISSSENVEQEINRRLRLLSTINLIR